jgi:hypothetical protein
MTVLRDINITLKDHILPKIPELEDDPKSIVFDSPADITQAGNMLSIFLYQIVENGFLRNINPEPVGTTQLKYPPLAIDLYYIFTVYGKDRETELIIIERLLQLFHDMRVLKGDILKGELLTTGNDEIKIIPNNLTFEEINKLWERFPNKPYKLSASYIISPVRIPSAKEPEMITRVIERDINLYRK